MDHRSFKKAGYVALIAGLILILSGISSDSILLTGLGYVQHYIGPSIGTTGQYVVQLAVDALTYLIGFGGLLVIAGGLLLLTKHGSAGRFLIGLGGGMAIFGLLFAMAEALYVTGLSAPIFHEAYFGLYWIGAILATISIFMSRKSPETKPIV